MMLGVKTGCRGGERALLLATLILQQVNKERSGSVVEEVESFDLAFSTRLRFLDLTLFFFFVFFFPKVPVHVDDSADDFSNFEKMTKKHTTEWVCGSTKRVPLSCTGSISWQKKNKTKKTQKHEEQCHWCRETSPVNTLVMPQTALRCSSVCLLFVWGVGGHNTDHKALYSLRTIGGLEANSSALHREWGIELRSGVIRQPSGPSLSLAPLSRWRGSRWSSAAGWSWSWSPGDSRGCDWSSRDVLQAKTGWAPRPRGPGNRSVGRSHRRRRPGYCRWCSRATDTPTGLQADTRRQRGSRKS